MRQRLISGLHLGREVGTNFNLDIDLNKLPKKQREVLSIIGEDFIRSFDNKEDGYKLGGYEHCDFGWLNDKVFVLGLEPSYQWDKLLVFQFDFENKDNSAALYGTAFGPYGSSIAIKKKQLKDYKRKSKFTNFINEWYNLLKEALYE